MTKKTSVQKSKSSFEEDLARIHKINPDLLGFIENCQKI